MMREGFYKMRAKILRAFYGITEKREVKLILKCNMERQTMEQLYNQLPFIPTLRSI